MIRKSAVRSVDADKNDPMTPPLRTAVQTQLSPAIDQAALRAVDRAIGDLRRGEPLLIEAPDGLLLVRAVEGLSARALARLRAVGGGPVLLAVTRTRARVLGIDTPPALPAGLPVVMLSGIGEPAAERIHALSDPEQRAERAVVRSLRAEGTADEGVVAAVALAKLARLLPAVVCVPLRRVGTPAAATVAAVAARHDLVFVRSVDVLDYRTHAARSLTLVGEARVPLADAEATRVLAFRPADGGVEHLAVLIGEPDPDRPILARIHSECFTGDLLGSLRCDCGDQLRGAIAEIARHGAGVVLYLAQEGRGIGLVNKLRAYRLQDTGFDTVDANEQLGFDADERVYLPAAEMLRHLGFSSVRLMTNNPDKLRQLARCGIEVTERVPHVFPGNGHNEDYLRTKAERSGHLF